MADDHNTYQTVAEAVRKAEALAELARKDAQLVRDEIHQIHYMQSDIVRRIERLEVQFTELHKDFQAMNNMANKWKGGFIVLVALGGIIGWLSSVGGNILKVFK